MSQTVSEQVILLEDEAATEALGKSLAALVRQSRKGATVFLRGNLGMGKTTLSRGVMRGLGHEGAVKSPTYTIVEPYEHLDPVAYHFDLYRLGDPEELEYLGIRDYFSKNSLCLIEWAERGEGLLSKPDIEVCLELDGEGRRATLHSETSTGKELLAGLGSIEPNGQ